MQHLQNEITEKYKTWLQQLGYGKSTVKMLPACVKEFLMYIKATEVKMLKSEQINSFYEYLQSRKHQRKQTVLSEVFISHHMYALRVFFNWLEETGQIKYNPISNLKFKRPKVNTREPLSKEEILQLFESAENCKEIAILHLFYSCGLRRSEAESLNTSDIHFAKNMLYVREGKGAKRRAIPINETVKKELENYFVKGREKINACAGPIEDVFMFNGSQTRMKGDQYNRALKEIIKRALKASPSGGGLEGATLHHLRHSIATHLLENGLKIEFVRDFLGHSLLEATQIYAKVFKHQLKNL